MIQYRIPGLGIVAASAAFVLPDGTKYGAGWLLNPPPGGLAALGAEPVTREDRPAVNERFYVIGEVEDGNTISYTADPRPIGDILALRLAELAARRFQIETAGIDLAGSVVRTDEASQAKINGAYAMVQRDPQKIIDFKAANGWAQLDAATMTAIAAAVGDHVQACYSAEKTHSVAMAALAAAEDFEGLIAYDFSGGWPPIAQQ